MTKEERRAYQKQYYERHKEKLKARMKAWHAANKERHIQQMKQYQLENKNDCDAYKKQWKEDNHRHCNEYYANYRRAQYKNDINFRLRAILRTRLGHALHGNSKFGSAVKDLGCTIDELRKYIESKWTIGMSWDNYGLHGWHIDHIRPLVSFDLSDPEQVKMVCHYTNLQPLWAQDNLRKSDS